MNTRKLIQLGGSRVIVLPKNWLELQEKKRGQQVREFLITEHADRLCIFPVAPKPKERTKK